MIANIAMVIALIAGIALVICQFVENIKLALEGDEDDAD